MSTNMLFKQTKDLRAELRGIEHEQEHADVLERGKAIALK